MILTGNEILKKQESGEIIISPFCPENINPNSYNYRLGGTYYEYHPSQIIDSIKPIRGPLFQIPQEGLLLKPGNLYLCNTLEVIGSEKFVTSLIGKSSMGRLGLFLQISANIGHQGEIHQWTLELRCAMPIVIYPNMIIGQVTFWKTNGLPFKKEGYYSKFDLPEQSNGALL